jgi:GNAT superfamily N-acetyltransferase
MRESERGIRRDLLRQNWLTAYADLFSREEVDALYAGRLELDLSWAGERGEPLGTLVALEEGEITGVATLAPLASGDLEVTHLYVRVDRHRRGVGSALWEATIDVARQRGARLLHVWTLERGPSVGFYESRGCRRGRTGTMTAGAHVEPMIEFLRGPPARHMTGSTS